MVVNTFRARDATVKFSSSAVTFDTATLLAGETYANTVAAFKNLTITPPQSKPSQIPLLGETAQTIGASFPSSGTFQNAAMDESNWSNAKFTGTLVLRGDEDFEPLINGGGTSITGGYTRYMQGASDSGKTRVVANAILFTFNNTVTSKVESQVFARAICNFGDTKFTGADGHMEIDVEGECLPENWGREVKD